MQGLNYQVASRCWTLEEAYHDWIATREPPLFGTEPDARVWALAGGASDPRTFRVLDIGWRHWQSRQALLGEATR